MVRDKIVTQQKEQREEEARQRREAERAKAKAVADELVNGGEVKHDNKDSLKIRHEGGVVIEGASDLLIRIAKCCNPVPGDEIVG